MEQRRVHLVLERSVHGDSLVFYWLATGQFQDWWTAFVTDVAGAVLLGLLAGTLVWIFGGPDGFQDYRGTRRPTQESDGQDDTGSD